MKQEILPQLIERCTGDFGGIAAGLLLQGAMECRFWQGALLAIVNALKDKYPIVMEPGPDVARLKVALTGSESPPA